MFALTVILGLIILTLFFVLVVLLYATLRDVVVQRLHKFRKRTELKYRVDPHNPKIIYLNRKEI